MKIINNLSSDIATLFFLAEYPYLFCYSINCQTASFKIFLGVSLFILLCAALVVLILRPIIKGKKELFTVAVIIMFGLNFFQLILSHLYFVAFVLLISGILVKKEKFFPFLKGASVVLFVFIIFNFISNFNFGLEYNRAKHNLTKKTLPSAAYGLKEGRSVYIILLDMYPGNNTLVKNFGVDNKNFYDELTKQDFYVNGSILSNYNKTTATISSILNYGHYYDKGYKTFESAVVSSSLFEDFKKEGYHTSYFMEGYNIPKNKNIDEILTFNESKYWDEYSLYLKNSIFFVALNSNKVASFLKVTGMSLLDEIKYDDFKRFYFIHLMAPHHPYLRNKYMQPIVATDDFQAGLDERYINKKSYIDYLEYTNITILKTVQKIIAKSKYPPVIVIFGDHGPRMHYWMKNDKRYYGKYLLEPNFLNSHFETIFAVYYPDCDKAGYKKAKTLVNLFIELSNNLFNKNERYVKDTLYYTHYDVNIFDLNDILNNSIDVTSSVLK